MSALATQCTDRATELKRYYDSHSVLCRQLIAVIVHLESLTIKSCKIVIMKEVIVSVSLCRVKGQGIFSHFDCIHLMFSVLILLTWCKKGVNMRSSDFWIFLTNCVLTGLFYKQHGHVTQGVRKKNQVINSKTNSRGPP